MELLFPFLVDDMRIIRGTPEVKDTARRVILLPNDLVKSTRPERGVKTSVGAAQLAQL